jgi:hypothetical protein
MDYNQIFQSQFNVFSPSTNDALFFIVLMLLAIWSLIWKGLALWKAAKNSDKVWYVLLLAINTVGILEIVYYFYISKRKAKEKKK